MPTRKEVSALLVYVLVGHFCITYMVAMFLAILQTPEAGFEWQLAWEMTKEAYSWLAKPWG
jgi:hypothetical protein